MLRHQESWVLDHQMPADWPDLVRRLQASVFHTPLGLRAAAPEGTPIFARYVRGGEVVGLVAGVRTRCRLGGHFRHYYFPAGPVFSDPRWREPGLARLLAAFRAEGVAEARWDSFDGGVGAALPKAPTRWEYVLDLAAMDEKLHWPDAPGHRRLVHRGERQGWQLREPDGVLADATLTQVSEPGIGGHARSRIREGVRLPTAALDPVDAGMPWGTRTYAAYQGAALLAAILVGRCGTRAYCLTGGTTETGRAVGASVWLQAQVAVRLADAGFTEYNLGGAPRHAPEPGDPSHGVHRFKTGFGTRILPRAGDHWVLLAAHLRGHRLFDAATGLAS